MWLLYLETKKHRPVYEEVVKALKKMGYHIHSEILNAVDFGIPQNRERLFVIGTLKKVKLEFKKQEKGKLEDFLRAYYWYNFNSCIQKDWLEKKKILSKSISKLDMNQKMEECRFPFIHMWVKIKLL